MSDADKLLASIILPSSPFSPRSPVKPGSPSRPSSPGVPGIPASPFTPARPGKPSSPFRPLSPGRPCIKRKKSRFLSLCYFQNVQLLTPLKPADHFEDWTPVVLITHDWTILHQFQTFRHLKWRKHRIAFSHTIA